MDVRDFAKIYAEIQRIFAEIVERITDGNYTSVAICVWRDNNGEIHIEHEFGVGVCECGEWANVCYGCYEAKCDNCEYRRQHF